jgi:predicted DNA binding CopG/RHH family protein
MKEPRIADLRFDSAETRRVRRAATRVVKITLNIDGEVLAELRRDAEATGVPYQRLINRILRDNLNVRGSTEARLARLERQLAALMKKIAA